MRILEGPERQTGLEVSVVSVEGLAASDDEWKQVRPRTPARFSGSSVPDRTAPLLLRAPVLCVLGVVAPRRIWPVLAVAIRSRRISCLALTTVERREGLARMSSGGSLSKESDFKRRRHAGSTCGVLCMAPEDVSDRSIGGSDTNQTLGSCELVSAKHPWKFE